MAYYTRDYCGRGSAYSCLYAKANYSFLFRGQSLRLALPPRIYEGITDPQSYLIVNYAPLRRDIMSYIDAQKSTIAVYVVNLRDGASMSINGQLEFTPGSMSKVPVAILIMKKVEEGELDLNTMIPIFDADRVEYSSSLFHTPEKELPLHVLLEKMLQESDNTACLFSLSSSFKEIKRSHIDGNLSIWWQLYDITWLRRCNSIGSSSGRE